MARITFGLATSHGPMLSIAPEYWQDRVSFDRENKQHFYKGKTYTFDQMVSLHRDAKLADQITPEISLERYRRCQNAIKQLADYFDQNRPDIAVVVGNDQMEIFTDQHVPAFAVFWGPYVEGHPRSAEFLAKLNTEYPCSPDLGRHVIQSVITQGFDVSQLTKLPTGAIGSNAVPHAYGFVYRRIMRDKVPVQVPVLVNTFYPPNQPPAGRCYEFGRALARAIASATPEDTKIAFIASGGMTHFVLDEDFDRELLDAMQKGDAARLAAIPENMFQAGTSEIKNWIVVAGAMAEAGLTMDLVDYVPCYRSEAGTGSAMGFARWC
jgi:3-O-methylgallate 3,4-dioxygenase